VTPASDIAADLRNHLSLHTELLGWIERESQALRQPDGSSPYDVFQARKEVLPRLEESLGRIRAHRATWLAMSPAERAANPEVRNLIRQNQDLIMRLIVLDRENEQLLLRRGLIPAKQLPPVNRQRPHYVADLYRKQGTGASAGAPSRPPQSAS
jgi:hypothetical protein